MFNEIRTYAKPEFFQLLGEEPTVDKIDRRSAVPRGFAPGLKREVPRADDNAFVCPADHGAAKIADDIRAEVALVAFALKEDVETDQATKPDRAVSVDPSIAAASGDLYFNEPGLA